MINLLIISNSANFSTCFVHVTLQKLKMCNKNELFWKLVIPYAVYMVRGDQKTL
jgi:hypothetical protein